MLEDLFRRLEVDYVFPPRSSSQALSLGAAISPELACLPLKITLGNMIQGLRAGADTIVMMGGWGPCRFGYYSQIQKIVLKRAGYKFKMLTVEPPSRGLSHFTSPFKFLAPGISTRALWNIVRRSFQKGRAVDLIEKACLQNHCYVTEKNKLAQLKKQTLYLIDRAESKNEINEALRVGLKTIDSLKTEDKQPVLKIGIVGEFYLLLEPFVNFDIENYLGSKGVYLERSVYMSDWISPSGKNVVGGHRQKEIEKLADPFLSQWVGGEGQVTIGHTISFAKRDFDGVIHLLPFTCMPELIAQSILPAVQRQYDIPILTLVVDEQTGRAGVVTRLEAFIDLLLARKNEMLLRN